MGRELLCCWGYNPRGGQAASVHRSFSLLFGFRAGAHVSPPHPLCVAGGLLPNPCPSAGFVTASRLAGRAEGSMGMHLPWHAGGNKANGETREPGRAPIFCAWSAGLVMPAVPQTPAWFLGPDPLGINMRWDQAVTADSVLLMEWISKLKAELVSG